MPETNGQTHPLAIIEAAIARGVDPAQLEKLMDLQERWEHNRAAEVFAAALAGFQSECHVVLKERTAGKEGHKFSYKFASYDDVMAEAAPVLAKHKIAISFSTKPFDKGLEVTCRVRVGIHFEDHSLGVPIPQMQVNDTQRFGAALSYAKRYALCAALNIVVTGEDDDAARQMELVGEEHVEQLTRLIAEKRVDLKRFLAWAEIVPDDAEPDETVYESTNRLLRALGKMLKSQFPKAIDMLRRKAAPK